MATINDILTEVDELKPNQYDDAQKISWISNLELRVVEEVAETHEGGLTEFNGYTTSDINEELLVPEPHTDIYKYYLFALIDFCNGEMDRYSSSTAMYNAAYESFKSAYNRKNLPLSRPLQLF